MKPWQPAPDYKPTHRILRGHQVIQVMLDADAAGNGPAYTLAEWMTYEAADYERRENRWYFQGQPAAFTVEPLEGGRTSS